MCYRNERDAQIPKSLSLGYLLAEEAKMEENNRIHTDRKSHVDSIDDL